MRTQFLKGLLFVGLATSLILPAFSAPAPTKAEIEKIVAAAATCQAGQSREPFRQLEELVGNPSSSVRRHLEEGLVRLLEPTSTFEARRFACKQLGIIGDKRALSALAKLLLSEETAGIACLALTTYPPGKTDEILRAALPSAPGVARVQIIDTLGDRRDAKAVKLLGQFATNAEPAVAGAAITALGKIGNQAAWKSISSLSKDANAARQPALTEATVRCADTLALAGDRETALPIYEALLVPSQPTYVRRAAFDALVRLDNTHAVARILEVLHGQDPTLRAVAIANVRALASNDASGVFAAELPQLPSQEQIWMIDSLAARDDAPACAAIGKCLESPDANVRRAAIDALGRIGDTWCVALFVAALDQTKGVEERRALEAALVSLSGGAQADRAMITALKKASGATRASLVTAVALRQGPAANLLLLDEADQSDAVIAKAALRALSKTAAERELTPLLEVLTQTRNAEVRSEAASAAAQALTRIDKPARRSALVRQALGWAQRIDSQIALLGLLPGCGDPAALAELKTATRNPDSRVRDAAVSALAEWPDASAWDALAALYRQPATESVRTLALRGLVRLAGEENAHPSAQLIARYRELLAKARSDADLRLILGALGGDAQPEALQIAVSLLDNAGVRAEAEVAVKRIAEAIKAQHPKAAQDALSRLQSKP
jgi:HEAT repeat protein